MSITFGTISRIRPGEAKVYKNVKTGFEFEAVGDGKVEPALLQRVEETFGPVMTIKGVDDLSSFMKASAEMEKASRTGDDPQRLSKEEHAAQKKATAKSLTELAQRNLGPGWRVAESDLSFSYYGTINRFEAVHSERGIEQSVDIQRNRDDLSVRLKTETPGIRGKVLNINQSIEFDAELDTGAVKEKSLQEQVSFHFAP